MKRRTYILTTGSYSSYRIVAVVEGPARPALSTLRNTFNKELGLDVFQERQYNAATIEARVKAEMDADRHLAVMGYTEDSLAENFLLWLIRNHRFTIVGTIQEVSI